MGKTVLSDKAKIAAWAVEASQAISNGPAEVPSPDPHLAAGKLLPES